MEREELIIDITDLEIYKKEALQDAIVDILGNDNFKIVTNNNCDHCSYLRQLTRVDTKEGGIIHLCKKCKKNYEVTIK